MLSALGRAIHLPKFGSPPPYVAPPAYDKPPAFGQHETDELTKSSIEDAQWRFEEWLQREAKEFELIKPGRVGNERAFDEFLGRRHPEYNHIPRLPRAQRPSPAQRQTVRQIQEVEASLGLSNPFSSIPRPAQASPDTQFMNRSLTHARSVSNNQPASPTRVDPVRLAALRQHAIRELDGRHLRALLSQGLTREQLLQGASNNERLQLRGLLRGR